MATRDQVDQVNTMNQQNSLNTSNQNKQPVVLHPKASNHNNNSSYNINKGISQYNTLPSSHQSSKPVKKKGFYGSYNGYNSNYQNGNNHYTSNNSGSYYHSHNKFNTNHMSTKSQGKNLNYHRAYNNQSHHSSTNTNSNHNNEKYDSVANSVSPPSNSNSSNNTASPSNLASPNSLSNLSSTITSITNISNSNNGNQANSVTSLTDNSIDKTNATNTTAKQLEQQQIIETEQSSKIESTMDRTNNLVNDMNNLQINSNNHSGNNSKSEQSQPPSSSTNIMSTEKSASLVNQTTMSFKTTNNVQNLPQNYVNHPNKPYSPEAFVSSNMIMNSNSSYVSTVSGKPTVSASNHYASNNGGRNNQSNKMHYSNNSSYPMNNSLNNTGGYPSFQNKINNNYARGGGKKPQHLLNNNTATSKSPQIMNQTSMSNNGNSYGKMNTAGMTHLVGSTANKMMPNPTISQNHSMIPTHTQMIAPNGYPIFYNPNFINQHSQNQIAMPNAMHNQNVHLPQNCVQCQYSMNGQYMPANAYHPPQFVHFPPYQYNPNQMTGIHTQTITGSMNPNLTQQQPHHRLQYSDSQVNRQTNQPTNVNQSTSNASQQQQTTSTSSSASNKYAQQQDHMTGAPTHLPQAQFAYNSYMPIHAIPNYYYSAAASNYNESQLNPHLISNSSAAMMAQQHQLQVSILNNLQHHQTQANHSGMIMSQQSQNEQFVTGSSNVDSISSNAGDNTRSTANYDANNSNYNSLLLQAAPQTVNQPSNAISPLSSPFDGHAMNGKFYSTNYASNTTLSDYNTIIWPQQQQQQNSNAAPPNLLIGNTGSNNNHFTNDDMLSSHDPNKTSTNAINTDILTNSNIVNQIAESTGLLDKK